MWRRFGSSFSDWPLSCSSSSNLAVWRSCGGSSAPVSGSGLFPIEGWLHGPKTSAIEQHIRRLFRRHPGAEGRFAVRGEEPHRIPVGEQRRGENDHIESGFRASETGKRQG